MADGGAGQGPGPDQVMLLAAGRGRRLRPLTDHIPKALVEVAGETLLARHLGRLAEAGFLRVVANVHWLPEPLTQALRDGAASCGLDLHISQEERLLGTAGALRRVTGQLAGGSFALVSADIWSDFPYARLRSLAAHLDSGGCAAVMVLVPVPPGRRPDCYVAAPQPGGDGAKVAPVAASEPDDCGGTMGCTYSGLAVLHPSLLARIPPGEGPLELWPDLLRPAARQGLVRGLLAREGWADCGTHASLASLRARREREVTGA